MLSKPIIIGARGSMGQRYQAILKYIGVDFYAVDKDDAWPDDFDSAIVATPTETHAAMALMLAKHYGVPVLVEKPFSTDPTAVRAGCEALEKAGAKVRMVNQYAHLPWAKGRDTSGPTNYNFFRHGSDGLAYDCISILALAKDDNPRLWDTSPVWGCMLNGAELSLSDVDLGYVGMVQHFLKSPPTTAETDYILHAHRAVERYLERN